MGGGLLSHGFSVKYSTISGNYAQNGGGAYAVDGSVYLLSALISNNTAQSYGGLGAINLDQPPPPLDVTIVNSTIAHNAALNGEAGGAVFYGMPAVKVYNSTIAFNTANTGANFAPGLSVRSQFPGSSLKIESVLASNNTFGTAAIDYDFSEWNVIVTGSNNLVYASSSTLPPDTIVGRCPLLGPLRDNGGTTQTIALGSGSPALDAGNNTFKNPLQNDQRGSPFGRVSGDAADIGAYEVDQADIIFVANLEGCS
jgi:hypothetical protein